MKLQADQSLNWKVSPETIREGDKILVINSKDGKSIIAVSGNSEEAYSVEVFFEPEYFGGYYEITTEAGTITHRRDLLVCKLIEEEKQ